MLNIHNIQNVILLWAISFKSVSLIIWCVWMTSDKQSFYTDTKNTENMSRRKICFKWGSITGIVGLVLLSIYILMNM